MRALRLATLWFIAAAAGVALLVSWTDSQTRADDKSRKATGIEKRVPWTTSRVQGSPEPPSPYRLENAFPKIKFDEPLEMVQFPGTKRIAVSERKGKIYTFENRADASEKQLLIDVGRNVYGFALPRNAAESGNLFVMSINDPTKDEPNGSRISRYKLKQKDPPVADPASEKVILTWPSGGHNGGCMRFGPDGYLYIATGDGSGIADSLETGQDLSDLLGSILRLDVNRVEEGVGYSIPPDNPFVNVKGARPEIYAYGLRQPWKFSFDRATGDLWAGEVGQDLWEMVYRIEK